MLYGSATFTFNHFVKISPHIRHYTLAACRIQCVDTMITHFLDYPVLVCLHISQQQRVQMGVRIAHVTFSAAKSHCMHTARNIHGMKFE